jgi:hypothetical protein
MKTEFNNIGIASYNVFWKIMDYKNSDLPINKKIIKQYKKNILENIKNLHNYYNPAFYCFQEASSFKSITKIFNNSFSNHVGISDKEYILTIWNNTKYNKLYHIDSEFEKGRPFTILIFEDVKMKINFIIINLHAGHYKTYEKIIIPIQETININKNILKKYDIKRIIMVGDFNCNISKEINKNNDFYILLDNKYYFKSIINNNKTCCSLLGYGYKHNYDHVIDTKEEPIITHQLSKEKWYKPLSSDHIMILSIINNNK